MEYIHVMEYHTAAEINEFVYMDGFGKQIYIF